MQHNNCIGFGYSTECKVKLKLTVTIYLKLNLFYGFLKLRHQSFFSFDVKIYLKYAFLEYLS